MKYLIVLMCSLQAYASPFKDAQLSVANSDLDKSTYEYTLKFKLFGLDEYNKWQKVKSVDQSFKNISGKSIVSEIDFNNLQSYIYALEIREKQKEFREYNQWMQKFRKSITDSYEKSTTDVALVLKIITEDEDQQLSAIELNDKKSEILPAIEQLKVSWDDIPNRFELQVENILDLLERSQKSPAAMQSIKDHDLYARLAIAEYEYSLAKDTSLLDSIEINYEKDYAKENQDPSYGIKATFNLNFFKDDQKVIYAKKYDLQRKLFSERSNVANRSSEVKNIKLTLKDDLELLRNVQRASFKELNFLTKKSNLLSAIDLQTIQNLQKNKFNKNLKLTAQKTAILEKILILMYETQRPMTLTEFKKYVR